MNTFQIDLANTFTEGKNITTFHGKANILTIYEQALMSKNMYALVNGKMVDMYFPENTSLFRSAINIGRLKAREIVEISEDTTSYSNSLDTLQYQYKYFPKNWDQNIFFDYLIFDNTVAIVRDVDSELYGLLIKDSKVFKGAADVFLSIWNLLPTPKVKNT